MYFQNAVAHSLLSTQNITDARYYKYISHLQQRCKRLNCSVGGATITRQNLWPNLSPQWSNGAAKHTDSNYKIREQTYKPFSVQLVNWICFVFILVANTRFNAESVCILMGGKRRKHDTSMQCIFSELQILLRTILTGYIANQQC